MKLLSATDVAIALASKNGSLKITEHTSRFGDKYAVISDNAGIIEVADSVMWATLRVAEVTERAK